MAPSRVGDPRPRLMAVTSRATAMHRIRRIGGLHTFFGAAPALRLGLSSDLNRLVKRHHSASKLRLSQSLVTAEAGDVDRCRMLQADHCSKKFSGKENNLATFDVAKLQFLDWSRRKDLRARIRKRIRSCQSAARQVAVVRIQFSRCRHSHKWMAMSSMTDLSHK